jgi:hypothetical protein
VEYTGVNSPHQQQIIDDVCRSPRLSEEQKDRERSIRYGVERISLNVQRLCGIPEGHGGWSQAVRAFGGDADGIWFRPNAEGGPGQIRVGDRQWEVLGEVTGRTGRRRGERPFGSSIAEQRDTLFELVAEEADRFRVNARDAPAHRRPLEDREFVDPGKAYASFSRRVNHVWLQSNFGKVVDAVREEGLLSEQTADRLMEQAPNRRASMQGWAAEVAAGELSEDGYRSLAARPKTLQLDATDTALKGFLDDMAAHSGTAPAQFLNKIQVAPPDQKAWQVADSLMAKSPLSGLPEDKYLEAKERLSVVVGEQVWSVNDAATHGVQEVRQQAAGQVISALKDLEAEAATPPREAAPVRLADPRVGVAEPGGRPAVQTDGDGSATPRRTEQRKPQSPSIG